MEKKVPKIFDLQVAVDCEARHFKHRSYIRLNPDDVEFIKEWGGEYRLVESTAEKYNVYGAFYRLLPLTTEDCNMIIHEMESELAEIKGCLCESEDNKEYLYAACPFRWRKTPDGDCDEYEYPVGTKVEVIGLGPRGYDVIICDTGVKCLETAMIRWSKTPVEVK